VCRRDWSKLAGLRHISSRPACPALPCPLNLYLRPRPSRPLLFFLSPSHLSVFNFTMSSKSIEWNDWLIEKLGKELAIFDNDTSSLLLNQDHAFKLYCDLLGEDAERLAKRLSSRRSVRLQARELLTNVFRFLGPKVFLLFTLAVSISKLSEIAPHTRLPKIRSWWETAPHLLGLAVVAKELCEANSISTLISSS